MRLRGMECARPRYAEAFYAPQSRRRDGRAEDSMRVLVTGSHGYIGSVLAPSCCGGRPRRRRARHVLLPAAATSGRELGECRRRRADVRDVVPRRPRGVRRDRPPRGAVERPDRRPRTRAGRTTSTSTRPSASRARRGGRRARFVFASSCSMYGASDDGRPVDEDAPLRPLTPTPSRRCAQRRVSRSSATATSSPVSMRNATVYGVSPRLRLDIVLNNLAAWAHTTGTHPPAQ